MLRKEERNVITIAAKIGSGKSSLAKILGDVLDSPVYYEPVEESENPILPLYYKDQKKYGFLLQIFFLNKRFDVIKQAYKNKNGIVDSSIYTDSIFLDRLHKDGIVTQQEHDVYHALISNMMEEIEGLPYKKRPDLMIGIDISFENELSRIGLRGREFEQDAELINYFKKLSVDYDEWYTGYNISDKYTINGDKYDFVNNKEDRSLVVTGIIEKLHNVGKLTDEERQKSLIRLLDNLESMDGE